MKIYEEKNAFEKVQYSMHCVQEKKIKWQIANESSLHVIMTIDEMDNQKKRIQNEIHRDVRWHRILLQNKEEFHHTLYQEFIDSWIRWVIGGKIETLETNSLKRSYLCW